MIKCDECKEYYGDHDLLPLEGNHDCASCKPIYVQRLREGASTQLNSDDIFVEGKFLAVKDGAKLNDNCIFCNNKGDTRKTKKFFYVNPGLIALIILVFLISKIVFLVLLIFYIFKREKFTVEYSLCSKHANNYIYNGFLLLWASISVGVYIITKDIFKILPILLIGLVLFLILSAFQKVVLPKKKIQDFYLLKGISKEYLENIKLNSRN